jgi:hypothetical protein
MPRFLSRSGAAIWGITGNTGNFQHNCRSTGLGQALERDQFLRPDSEHDLRVAERQIIRSLRDMIVSEAAATPRS